MKLSQIIAIAESYLDGCPDEYSGPNGARALAEDVVAMALDGAAVTDEQAERLRPILIDAMETALLTGVASYSPEAA